jgi:nucleoid-associated protein YgaU
MRTDVKIGAAVGLAVVVLVVLYVVFSSSSPPASPQAQSPAAVDQTTEITDVVEPRISSPQPAPAIGSTSRPADLFRVPPGHDETVSVDVRLTPATPTSAPRAAGTGTVGPAIAPTPIATVGPAPAVPPAPKAPQTYTVAAGDMGFWAIAAKVYGDGKYMYLIAEGNPGVNSSALKVGQVLKIPPLPLSAAAVKPAGPAGATNAPTAAGRTYTVKEGQGYWVIAQEVYGNGKYWVNLQNANPGKVLRPGTVLVVPDLPSGAGASAPPATVRPRETTPAPSGSSAPAPAAPLRPRFN